MSANRNMLSAEEHPEVVERYLAKEQQFGRVIGSGGRYRIYVFDIDTKYFRTWYRRYRYRYRYHACALINLIFFF